MISRFGVRLAAVAYRSVQSAFVCASPEARRRDDSFEKRGCYRRTTSPLRTLSSAAKTMLSELIAAS